MTLRYLSTLLATLVTLLFAGAAVAQKRVALVIGNSAYSAVAPLTNPKNDAAAIAGMLRRVGFDSVELALDQRGDSMRGQLAAFAEKSVGADVALVYYAGHGIEVGGVNYLLPVDAGNLTPTTVSLQGIALDSVMNAIADARQLKLIILDACRDNPFAAMIRRTGGTRSVGQGLARVEPSSPETLVAYAAREGTFAQDGDGANSPYTEALLRHLGEPDLDIRLAFGRVRDDVIQKTSKRQEPFVYGSLGGQVTALVRGAGSANVVAQAPTPVPATSGAPNAEAARSSEPPVRVAALPAPPEQVAAPPAASGAVAIPAADLQRIRSFAEKNEVPLPALDITGPATRSGAGSNWIGVWGTEGRWGGGGRWVILTVTGVDASGVVTGTYAYGPPGPASWAKSPAGRMTFTSKPDGNRISFNWGTPYTFELKPDGSMIGSTKNSSGREAFATLRPLWRPSDQSAKPKK